MMIIVATKKMQQQIGMISTVTTFMPYSARLVEHSNCSSPPFGVPLRQTCWVGWQQIFALPSPHSENSKPLFLSALQSCCALEADINRARKNNLAPMITKTECATLRV